MTDTKNQDISAKIHSNHISKNIPKLTLKNLNRDTPDTVDDQIDSIDIINHNIISDRLKLRLNSSNNSRKHISFNDNYSNSKHKEKKMDNIYLIEPNIYFNTERKKHRRSIIDEDKKKLKKQSNIMKIMMKMNTISNNNEKENEFHNIILPYINQTEKKIDKQKILKCSLRKKNTTIYSQNPLELSFGDNSINDNQNTIDINCGTAQRNLSHDSKKWFLNTDNKINKTKDLNRVSNTIYNSNGDLTQPIKLTTLKKPHSKNSYKKILSIYDNTKDKNHKYIVKFENIENEKELSPANLDVQFPNYPKVKHSQKEINKHIKCFAVNTYKGLMKTSNEDKVSIILSVCKPKNYNGYWPKCSFLALFDGKFGKNCCTFLRDELHNYIIKNNYFPNDPKNAILTGFKNAEKKFMKKLNENSDNKNGSCALVAIIIDDMLYIANCGDSHAILSMNNGKKIKKLNYLHNLDNLLEKQRIIENGGQIVNSKSGKLKILPGKLSISRGFGFPNAKLEKFGGKKDIIIETPEINEIKIYDNEFDFLLLVSGGVYEKMTVDESIKSIYNVIYNQEILGINSIHQLSGMAVDMLLKTAIIKGSLDNVTCILIGFENFKLGNQKDLPENIITVGNDFQRRDKKKTEYYPKGMDNIKKKNDFEEDTSLSNNDDCVREDNKSDEEKEIKNGIKDDKSEIIKFRRRSQINRFTIRNILNNLANDNE